MRVRYGKPIKAKSLLGNQFSSLTGDSFSTATTVIMLQNQHYYYSWKWGSFKYNFTLPSHKYFFYAKFKNNLTIRHIIVIGTQNDGSIAAYDYYNTSSPIISNERYATFDNTNSAVSRLDNIHFYYNSSYSSEKFNSNIDIPEYWILVDLTDMFGSGKEPTREEFYNKYNKYFPLIATGEEITIDDKAGQVSLKKLLPDEYQEVEYIEGDGGQYMPVINNLNNRAISGNLTVGYKFQATVHDRAMYFSTIECNLSSSQAYSLGYISANSYLYIRWNQMVNSNTQVVGYQVGDIVEVIRTNNVETILKTYSLFTHGDSSTLTWKGRIYKYWLKLDNEYLFNWIPCYRKSDNVIGLYDLVSGTFSTNIGTGTFLKGNNVNNTISCKVAGGSSDIYYGYNQLCENGDFSNSKSSWADWNSTTVVTNGIAEITRTNTSQSSLHQDIAANPGDKIYVRATMWSDGTTPVRLGLNGGISWSGTATTSTTPVLFEVIKPVVSTGNGCRIELFGTGVANTKYYAKEINAINLTTWFGAGKEPSTVEEFKEKFAKEYYGACLTPIKLTRYQIEALPTYGYNQLLNNPTFVLSCTTSQVSGKAVGTVDFVANNKYLIRCYQDKTMTSNTRNTFLVYLNGSPTYENTAENYNLNSGNRGWIYTPSESGTGNVQLWAHTPSVAVNYSDFQVINLTDWYGPGNEPTTVEEFKQSFPNKYYPYSKKRLLNKYMINKLIN